MTKRMQVLRAIGTLAALGAVAAQAAEPNRYPSRPIRMLVGFTPGGSSDVVARVMSKRLSEAWNQQVVVDNRPGAGGVLAAEIVARATADGHTLICASSSLAMQPSITRDLSYDPGRDFAPITQVVSAPYLMLVHPSVEAKTLKEFIALAKARPGRLNYASAGAGSVLHLAAEMFKYRAGVDLVHVPYKGAVGVVDLLAGQVQMSFTGLPQGMPHVKTGKLRLLAVTSATRSPVAPDTPTMIEAGVPGYELVVWYGMLGPAAMPAPLVAQLHRDMIAAMQSAEVKQAIAAIGFDAVGNTPAEFGALIRREIAQWAEVVKRTGIRAD